MKKIKTLLVTFSNDIGKVPITAFRGAVVEKVGREHALFHNHSSDNTFIYRYPLIQYKKLGIHPAIFCIDAGVDDLHNLFGQRNWKINLKDSAIKLEVERLDLKPHELSINGRLHTYELINWRALNQNNEKRYNQFSSNLDRLTMLQNILVGNILSFAKGIDWHIEERIEIKIHGFPNMNKIPFKEIDTFSFNLTFDCNVFLPNWMGLGKGASTGSGIIKELIK